MKTVLALLLCVLTVPVLAAGSAPVSYPEGYRDWQHVKSMVIQPGHPLYESFGGIHHLYANRKALQGYKTGRFPDGAVIIFDLLEAKSEGNAIIEGSRKVLGVMHKNSRQYKDTGGWGFEGFKGGSKTERAVGPNATTACYQCHTQQKDRDFVFSATRD